MYSESEEEIDGDGDNESEISSDDSLINARNEKKEDEKALRRKYLSSSDPLIRRNYWLKRDPQPSVQFTRICTYHIPSGTRRRNLKDETRPKLEDKLSEKKVSESFEKVVEEILERRVGKGNLSKKKITNPEEDLRILEKYYDEAMNDLRKLEVKLRYFFLSKICQIILVLLPIRMDYSRQLSRYTMNRELWLENYENLQEFLRILKNRRDILGQVRVFQKDGEVFYKEKILLESFSAHFEELDIELSKAFRGTETSSMVYQREKNHLNV